MNDNDINKNKSVYVTISNVGSVHQIKRTSRNDTHSLAGIVGNLTPRASKRKDASLTVGQG